MGKSDDKGSVVSSMTLMDRVLFAEAIESKEFAELCLSIIMDDNHVLKMPPQAEKELRDLKVMKYIKMDSFMEDEMENVFDVEVQKVNENNLPRRSRYYQGIADSKLIKPGDTDFNSMKNMYVIVISAFDPYGRGKYCYTFSNTCETIENLPLNDGGKRIFLSTKGKDSGEISTELMWMLRYFEETTEEVAELSKSRRIKRMNEIVMGIKSGAEFDRKARAYMEEVNMAKRIAMKEGLEEGRKEGKKEGMKEGIKEGLQQGMQEGLQQGLQKAHVEDAKRFKAKGIPLDIIAECTGLPLTTVEAI